MCSTHCPTIPPELLLKIFHHSDCKTLSTLLTVSRSINELAVPLLYEDVRLIAPQMGRKRTPSFQSAIDCFSASVSANSGRSGPGAWVKRLHLRVPFARQTGSEWCRILPFCPNLRYLDLSTCLDPYGPLESSALYSQLVSVSLTRLSLESIPSPTSFKSFLESQYALGSLSIRQMVDVGFSLSPDALPNLIHLSGPWSFLAAVIPGRNVAHLEIDEFSPSIDENQIALSMAQALDNVQSLYIYIDGDAQEVTILPHLRNLKYVTIVYSPPSDPLQSQLTQLSSTKLRYLRVACMATDSYAVPDLNWTVLFKMIPSLCILDVHPTFDYDDPWYRYRFDDLESHPKEVDLDYDVWQQWWHVIEQNVEDAGSKDLHR